jgi:UDP-N-acetylglucosamine--N-acetylmuramyl-(pentapeptide) pyrophosphoryl-undecaprenol N-acetylglucosamine transferase
MDARVMVMAGGTGGHVFPALAVAEELRERGSEVFWLGTPDSFESGLVPQHGFPLETIGIQGLRGNGLLRWALAPFKLAGAMWQASRIIRRRRPALVLGMGGFVTGPGGVVARLLGIPLVIHEQNAVPGMTNGLLSRIASRVLEAFPGSFPASRKAWVTGNPVRPGIVALPAPEQRFAGREGALRLLVLGGSQGALALNETLPAALAKMPAGMRPEIRHQAGRDKSGATSKAYESAGVGASVFDFVDDMAEAYAWADLVICRSGALTVAEIAAAGVGAILVPYPHAVDDHQTRNARYLTDAGAGVLLPQLELDTQTLSLQLERLLGDRAGLLRMAKIARSLALPGATREVADICEEVAGR